MKKLLACLLSFSLLVGSSMSVFAQETTNDSWMEIPTVYQIQSSYSIYIPEKIDFTDMGYSFSAESINILSDQIVYIVPYNTTVEMTNDSGETGTLHIRTDDPSGLDRVAVFENGSLTSDIRMSGSFEGATAAGEYRGTAQFQIFIGNK